MEPAKDRLDLGRRWRPALLSYFLRRVRDHADAEDLTQELITKLLKHEGDNFTSPEAYIFQMASNLLADRARRMRVRTQYREQIGRTEGLNVDPIDPFRIAAGRAELWALESAIAALPERTQKIFIMYRLENMSQEIIAETMDISVSAVKKHVARAMVSLMEAIRNIP